MFKNLSPGAIGIRADIKEGLRLAKATGFEGLDLNLGEVTKLAEEKSLEYVKELFEETGVRPGGWGLPVNWQGSEDEYKTSLTNLQRLARIGQALGSPWVATWIPPVSDKLPFKENFDFHVKRFRPIAEVLRDHGCRLGLEFIGPKTIRVGQKYEFIWTMYGMLELCNAIGTGNMGLLLDCWHWYTAHGTLDDLRRLKAADVVYVHVNDAPAGIPIDEQIDNVRCIPGETGVIDLVNFLKILNEIGYDVPVTPEPFSAKLNTMAPDDAASLVGKALAKAWQEAGI